ncbi:hypothetical protein V6N13_014697 [Hibiscus sabdariffa]
MHDVLGLRRIRVELDNGMAARLIQKGPHTNPTPSTILQHILEFCRRDWEVVIVRIYRQANKYVDLLVSKLGFGCMKLSGAYNDPVPVHVGISIIRHASDIRIALFDTSDIQGPKANGIFS